MKYIDADKLIAEIDKRYDEYRAKMKTDDFTYYEGMADALDLFEQFIGSLQQEHPEFPITDEEVEKALASIQNVELPDKYKTPDWLFKQLEQPQVADASKIEQPEVDLEKEIKRFLSNATKMNKGEWRGKYPISDIGFRATARHFYELGLNARKEDEQ